jgi:hypothetical protein
VLTGVLCTLEDPANEKQAKQLQVSSTSADEHKAGAGSVVSDAQGKKAGAPSKKRSRAQQGVADLERTKATTLREGSNTAPGKAALSANSSDALQKKEGRAKETLGVSRSGKRQKHK